MLVRPQLEVLRLHRLQRSYCPSWSVRVWPPNLKETPHTSLQFQKILCWFIISTSSRVFSLILVVHPSIHLANYLFLVSRTSWCSAPLVLAGVSCWRCAASSPHMRPAADAASRSDRFALLTFCKQSTVKDWCSSESDANNTMYHVEMTRTNSFHVFVFQRRDAVIMGFVTHSLWSLCIISLSLFCSFKRFFSMSLLLPSAVFISSSEIFCALRLCSAKAAGLESISPNTGRASEPGAVSEQRCSLCKSDANRQKNTKDQEIYHKVRMKHSEWSRTVLSGLGHTAFKCSFDQFMIALFELQEHTHSITRTVCYWRSKSYCTSQRVSAVRIT